MTSKPVHTKISAAIIPTTISFDVFFKTKYRSIHKNGINIDDIKIIIRLTSILFGFFNVSSFAITEPPAFCTYHAWIYTLYFNTLKQA